MKCLLDNDVFFAALYRGHGGHTTARRWLDRIKSEGWAISSETYLAAVRLMMNPAIMGAGFLSADTAIRVVQTELQGEHPGRVILSKRPPDPSLLSRAQGHRQIMDLWLVQIARDYKTKLATRDGGILAEWPELTIKVE